MVMIFQASIRCRFCCSKLLRLSNGRSLHGFFALCDPAEPEVLSSEVQCRQWLHLEVVCMGAVGDAEVGLWRGKSVDMALSYPDAGRAEHYEL